MMLINADISLFFPVDLSIGDSVILKLSSINGLIFPFVYKSIVHFDETGGTRISCMYV